MRHNPLKLISLFLLLVFISIAIALQGCASRIPANTSQCTGEPYRQLWDTVEECKVAVIKKEDALVKRRIREAKRKRRMEECAARRGVWDNRTNSCKPWSML